MTTENPRREENPNPDDPEYTSKWNEYQEMRRRNAVLEQRLIQKYGPNCRLSGGEGLQARLDLLTSTLLPPESNARVEFELAWQQIIANSLEALRNEAVEMELRAAGKLTLPGNGGLIVPGGG
jgi:hypothetical protein